MMKYEFEELAGYEVDPKVYSRIIEPMYMALPETISKQEFVRMLDKKSFALPTKKDVEERIKDMAKTLNDIERHFNMSRYEEYCNLEAELKELTQSYIDKYLFNAYAYEDYSYKDGKGYIQSIKFFNKTNETLVAKILVA